MNSPRMNSKLCHRCAKMVPHGGAFVSFDNPTGCSWCALAAYDDKLRAQDAWMAHVDKRLDELESRINVIDGKDTPW